jgi:hypothetical protein
VTEALCGVVEQDGEVRFVAEGHWGHCHLGVKGWRLKVKG